MMIFRHPDYRKQLLMTRRVITVALLTMTLIATFLLVTSAHSNAAVKWRPSKGLKWQYQLSSVPTTAQIDALTARVDAWDVDGFDTPKSTVDYIHSKGDRAICYLSAGSAENWRPDYSRFPESVKGNPLDGWPGERWVDTRDWPAVRTIMMDRAKMCQSKGFDAIEWDNVDGYTNGTGFPLTATTQIDYNKYLAVAAQFNGMAALLKNDVDQVAELAPFFDGAINEQCQQYNECGVYSAFTNANKFVGQVEYKGNKTKFCPPALTAGRSAMKKTLDLTASYDPC
jgi:hypothetical protein